MPDFEPEIENYRHKAEAFHAHRPVAGFATQLKVPIDIEDIYVPLRAMLDLRGIEGERFADAAHAEKMLRDWDVGLEISLAEAFRQWRSAKLPGNRDPWRSRLGQDHSFKTSALVVFAQRP